MCFEGEMPGVEEQDLRVRIVPLEGFVPGREKERIGLAPHGECRRPVDAEQIQLNVLIAGAPQQGRVERIGLWGHTRLIGGPVRVLPLL